MTLKLKYELETEPNVQRFRNMLSSQRELHVEMCCNGKTLQCKRSGTKARFLESNTGGETMHDRVGVIVRSLLQTSVPLAEQDTAAREMRHS